MQEVRFDATDSVVIVPLTTHDAGAPLTRVVIAADELSGIETESYAMVDKITTVRRTRLGARIGRATTAQMVDLERALLMVLGLAG